MAKIYKQRSNIRKTLTIILMVALIVTVIYGVWSMAESLERTQNQETLAATENAIVRSAVQCYALEGQYPTGIKYLEDNYGLALDREKYIYHYESIGANMVPVVKVFPLD